MNLGTIQDVHHCFLIIFDILYVYYNRMTGFVTEV